MVMGRRRFCELPVLILRYAVLGLARLIQVWARDCVLAQLAVRNVSTGLFNARFLITAHYGGREGD